MQHYRPHILIESNIPFIRGVFDDVADVSYLPPADITPQAMRDTDALITRTAPAATPASSAARDAP